VPIFCTLRLQSQTLRRIEHRDELTHFQRWSKVCAEHERIHESIDAALILQQGLYAVRLWMRTVTLMTSSRHALNTDRDRTRYRLPLTDDDTAADKTVFLARRGSNSLPEGTKPSMAHAPNQRPVCRGATTICAFHRFPAKARRCGRPFRASLQPEIHEGHLPEVSPSWHVQFFR